YLALADQRSRDVFSAVIRHRFDLSTDPLEAVRERDHPQWFAPEFLPRWDGDVFADGGAFDGDTVEGYVRARGSGYRAIHAFELDPESAERGQIRTAALANVTFHAVGLSDRARKVVVRRTGGTDGSIGSATEGTHAATVGRLDDLVGEMITYLKLDVEG